MTTPVAHVVFDLGDVVCRFDPAQRVDALVSATGRPRRVVLDAVARSVVADSGILNRDDAYASVSDAIGGISTDELRAAFAAAFVPDPEVLAVVAGLGCPASLFTNNGPILDDALDHELHAVAGHFATRHLSWRLGAMKPSPAAYARVQDRLEVAPAQVLFVDDRTTNVDAARAHGWQAEVFTGAADLEALLRGHELLGRATPDPG